MSGRVEQSIQMSVQQEGDETKRTLKMSQEVGDYAEGAVDQTAITCSRRFVLRQRYRQFDRMLDVNSPSVYIRLRKEKSKDTDRP